MFWGQMTEDIHWCQARGQLIPHPRLCARIPGGKAGKNSTCETGQRQAERRQVPRLQPLQHSQEPIMAALEDTYPPATGILLQKLPEFCQKNVPRSFALQGMGK